jgi:CO dehydrogenase maturation factor
MEGPQGERRPSYQFIEIDEGGSVTLTFSIAVSGKGGTGKTTIAALLIRTIWKKTGAPVLAIDADPNSNLNELLGVEAKKTVGDIREQLLKEKDELPLEQTKEDYLNYMIQTSLVESEGFDLLAMGRPEGPGCYCYVNTLLRKIVDSLSKNYSWCVMDAEAGLEHFSRRTTRDVDILLITTDPSSRGIMTAKRIVELVKELNTKFGKIYVVANRVTPEVDENVRNQITSLGLECLGMVPEDPLIQQFDLDAKPLTELPESSLARQSVEAIAERLQIG